MGINQTTIEQKGVLVSTQNAVKGLSTNNNQQKSIFEDWSNFITKIEDTIFPKLNSAMKDEKHGQISFGEKALNALAGVGKIFTTMLKNPIQTAVGAAVFGGIMAFAGPLAPVLVAGMFAFGTYKAINEFGKGETATTDKEARQAYQRFGAAVFTAITALFGAKAAVDTARANGATTSIGADVRNPIRNLIECFRLPFQRTNGNVTSIYTAIAHSAKMQMNRLFGTNFTSAHTTRLQGDVATATTARDTAQHRLDGRNASLATRENNYNIAKQQHKVNQAMIQDAPRFRREIQEQISAVNTELLRERTNYVDALLEPMVGVASRNKLAPLVTDCQNQLAALNARLTQFEPATIAADLARSAANLARAQHRLNSAQRAQATATTALETANTNLTNAQNALSNAQHAPNPISSILEGLFTTAQGTGLLM